MPQNPRRRHAFTLIELLVVIAIIALLLGIVMPALNRAIRNAKRNKAHTETQNIATAVEMFDREYGYLPIPESQRGDADFTYEGDASKSVFMVLMGEDQGDTQWDDLNFKDIAFLDMDALLIDGTLEDPWGRQYRLRLDRDMDQRLTYEGEEFRKRAIVISNGLNRVPDDEDDITNVVREN